MLSDAIQILSIQDPAYPSSLKEITDPPKQLYIRGNTSVLSYKNMLAVVGSRKSNDYGAYCINNLLPEALESDLCIVSGLAYGIDTLSHKACLESNSPTIAVLGSGIDDGSIYPKSNLELAHEIIKSGGAVISEYPPGTKPLPQHFPVRNRIIAGLSKATLLIQAAVKSGTLITARLAMEYNRDVLAVPGPINDMLSEGTNQLIQQGATPIIKPQDIIDIFSIATENIEQNLSLHLPPPM